MVILENHAKHFVQISLDVLLRMRNSETDSKHYQLHQQSEITQNSPVD